MQEPAVSFAQNELPQQSVPLSLEIFLTEVSKGNLGYIAQQFNVNIAQARLAASKVFPDPEFSVAYSNNQDRTLMMGQSVDAGISYPVSLGNKRGANISLAASEAGLSRMVLDAYYQNLRADAAKGYFEALRNLKTYEMRKESLEQLVKLARADSLRFANGEGSSIDAMQSALEAKAFLGDVYQSLSDVQNSSAELLLLMGKKPGDTLSVPAGDFPGYTKSFELSDLMNKALQNRADLLIAIKNKEVSEKNLRLIKAGRAPELTLNAGFSHNYIARNDIAPAPAYNAVTAGIDFPLKFSVINRGQLKEARLAVQQSEISGRDIENQIISEVFEAYNRYVSCNRKVNLYKTGIVADAEKILQGRIYSYHNGETGLVDVLNAQKTFIGLKTDYISALYEYSCALIDLEHAAGIWDIM